MASVPVQAQSFGNLSGVVENFFPTRMPDAGGAFGNDPLTNQPIVITFTQDAQSCYVRVLYDAPNDPYAVGSNNILLTAQAIYGEFYDAMGNLLATQNLYSNEGGGGVSLGARFGGSWLQAEVEVFAPIRSIKIYSPKEYKVAMYFQSGLVYTKSEPVQIPQISPTPVVVKSVSTPIPTNVVAPGSAPAPFVSRFEYKIDTKITVRKMSVAILPYLLDEAHAQITNTYGAFVDDERNTKLLLNFGSDYQKVIVNQKLSSGDASKLLLKLLTPLEPFVTTGQPVFISREVAKTTIEKIKVEVPPLLNPNPWLRPKIRHVAV